MHSDSITVDKSLPRKHVLFRPFIGVGPRQYINLFSMSLSSGNNIKRKIKGGSEKVEWLQKDAVPRVKLFDRSYIQIEEDLIEEINAQFTTEE